MQAKRRFSLRKKLVYFTAILALITYSTSAIFIYFIYDLVKDYIPIGEQWFVIITLLLGIIWSGILAFLASVVITKPLQKLEVAAVEAAQGNLNQEIHIQQSDDEIRTLSLAFDTMLKNIKEIVHNIHQNFDTTSHAVNQMQDASTTAMQHSLAINNATDDIAHGAVNAAEALQETVEAIEETTSLAKDVQDKAEQATSTSTRMLDTLTDSKTVVNQLVAGIQRLASDQVSSLKEVNHLKDNATEIESIITMVGQIAEQTNLLALNASIEAARAGEHGQGFAIVAEEIRKLADESAQAVQQISSLVQTMQNDVKHVVKNITSQVEMAETEAESGEKTNASMEEMSQFVVEVAEEIATIRDLVNRQLTLIQSTSQQSQEVAAIAEETSAATEEVSAAVAEQNAMLEDVEKLAQTISEQSSTLKENINQFSV